MEDEGLGPVWPIATYQPSGDFGVELMAHRGTLTLINDCVYVVDATKKHRSLVLFPTPDYQWQNGVLVGPRQTYRLGNEISLSGGSLRPSSISRLEGASIPEACDSRYINFLAQA